MINLKLKNISLYLNKLNKSCKLTNFLLELPKHFQKNCIYITNIKTSSNYHNIINIHSCRKIDAQNMQEKIMKENQ